MEGGLRDGGFLNLPPMPLCFGGGFGVNEDVSTDSFPYAYCKRERENVFLFQYRDDPFG